MSSADNNNGTPPPRLDVDAEGIPILNEVVEFEPFEQIESILEQASELTQPGLGLNLPKREQMLSAVRARIKSELHAELTTLIEEATAAAVAHASASLEQEIREHLSRTLEARLSRLIEESVDDTL